MKSIIELCESIAKDAKEIEEIGSRLEKLLDNMPHEEYLDNEETGTFDRRPSLECPYCGKELTEDRNACCGEAGHGVEPDICKHNQPKEDCEPCHLERGGS